MSRAAVIVCSASWGRGQGYSLTYECINVFAMIQVSKLESFLNGRATLIGFSLWATHM